MPFSFDGVSFDANGWVVEVGTNPWGALERAFSELKSPRRDGHTSVISGVDTPAIPFVIYTPAENLEALLVLFGSGRGVLSNGTRELVVDVPSAVPSPIGDPSRNARVNVIFRPADVFWRSSTEHIFEPVPIDAASVQVQLFPGLSAPIRDAIIRVHGQVNGLSVTDSRGSSFAYTADLLGTEYLRFESATGRAFITTSDTWSGGTEVTSLITNGPGPYYLELTPTFTDPLSRVALLTVASSSRSGSPVVEVRGKNAYLV